MRTPVSPSSRDDAQHTAHLNLLVEVKADKSRINLSSLKEKCEAFFTKNPTRRDELKSIRGLSLDDM